MSEYTKSVFVCQGNLGRGYYSALIFYGVIFYGVDIPFFCSYSFYERKIFVINLS
jgi:hypothetical protein